MRIFVAVEPVDVRKGIVGLAAIVRTLDLDPFDGCLFVFRSRSGASLKLLAYDGQGFWLCQKRLSTGAFRFWPKGPVLHPNELQAFFGTRFQGRRRCGNR
jgi:transposase